MKVCLTWGVHVGFVLVGLLLVLLVGAQALYCPTLVLSYNSLLSLSSHTQLTKNFNSKLEEYFQLVGEVSQSKKQVPTDKQLHTVMLD